MSEVTDKIVAMLDQARVTRDRIREEGGDTTLAQEQLDRTQAILDAHNAGRRWQEPMESLLQWQGKVGPIGSSKTE